MARRKREGLEDLTTEAGDPKEIRVKSIHIGQWQGDDGSLTYSLIALSEDGKVYRYKPSMKYWVPFSMMVGLNVSPEPFDGEEDPPDGDIGGY